MTIKLDTTKLLGFRIASGPAAAKIGAKAGGKFGLKSA